MSAHLSRRSLLQSVLALGVAAPVPFANAAPSVVTLRCSASQPADGNSSQYIWYQRFASNLKQSLGDRIRVDYFANGQLGKEADVVQQVRLGSVDMMITGSSIWATALPELALLDMGFLFDNWEHVHRAVDNGVGAQFNKMLEQRTGCTFIGWASHFNSRSVYTKNPVTAIAGLKNVKLRVLPAPVFIDTFKLLGAIPTPIPVNELYTAVQTGVVEGFEHDAATVLASKFNEVVRHCLLTEHLFSPSITAIGKRAQSKIPEDLRGTFQEAATEASRYQRQIAAQKGAEALETLKKLGIVFHPMDPREREAVRSTMETQLWASVVKQYPATQPMMDIIRRSRA